MVEQPESQRVTVLFSGGMDSMACAHFYLEARAEVDALFIDYGQMSASREWDAALRLARQFNIPLSKICVQHLSPMVSESGFIQGRNMGLIILGLMNSSPDSCIIALGIHGGTEYCDCSSEFVHLAQRILDFYTGGKMKIGAPFVDWNKVEIAVYCHFYRLPVDLTYSCELGLNQPCGKCKSCKDLLALHG